MTKCSLGDVVLVEFGYANGTRSKKRPALVISNKHYHKGRNEIIIAAITSNVHRILPGDTGIEKWRRAGLLFPSLVTCIIRTIQDKMILRSIGSLSQPDLDSALRNILACLG